MAFSSRGKTHEARDLSAAILDYAADFGVWRYDQRRCARALEHDAATAERHGVQQRIIGRQRRPINEGVRRGHRHLPCQRGSSNGDRSRAGQSSNCHFVTRHAVQPNEARLTDELGNADVRLGAMAVMPIPRRERPVVPVAGERRRRGGRPRRGSDDRRTYFSRGWRRRAAREGRKRQHKWNKVAHRRTMAAGAPPLNPKAVDAHGSAMCDRRCRPNHERLSIWPKLLPSRCLPPTWPRA
jgi:hypothetical protein